MQVASNSPQLRVLSQEKQLVCTVTGLCYQKRLAAFLQLCQIRAEFSL